MVFHALEAEQVRQIAAILLARLAARLESQLQLRLEWDEDVLAWLAEEGFDPQFGARPLKRQISRSVETALSRRIVAGEVGEGDHLRMSRTGNQIMFTKVN